MKERRYQNWIDSKIETNMFSVFWWKVGKVDKAGKGHQKTNERLTSTSNIQL